MRRLLNDPQVGLAPQIRRWFGQAIAIGGLIPMRAAGSLAPSSEEILFRIEIENGRRLRLVEAVLRLASMHARKLAVRPTGGGSNNDRDHDKIQ
jgi:hypothetical protein